MFWIIGAQRSGTTWLYDQLNAHPAITMAGPVRPEPKFFLDAERVAQGRKAYLSHYFPSATADQVLGEKGTSYLEHPEAGSRIRSFFPKAKAVAILRDPVHRAISNFRFSADNGMEPRTAREVFIEDVPPPLLTKVTSVSPFDYLKRGHYREQLQPWAVHFQDDLRVVIFEEIQGRMALLRELYVWLGIDPEFTPPHFHLPVNQSEAFGDGPIDPVISAALRRHFAPHISELEDWLGRKIPDWHDPL